MNKIEIIAVNELLGKNFFIPSYQRGYRWTSQQVEDLLNDVWEFANKKGKEPGEFYCLQPLVVKKDSGQYIVIDGQQRLTTIYLIIHYFNEMWEGKQKIPEPQLKYETRAKTSEALKNIEIENDNVKCEDATDDIDTHHILCAYKTIHDWVLKQESTFNRDKFKYDFRQLVQVIWYEIAESDTTNPIDTFTRLNIGKIPLTNAELIKSLFLNRANFNVSVNNEIRLRQQEIASEWDRIEYTLQNDEFWLFLNKADYNLPTRIDFIFDLICKQNTLNLKNLEDNSKDQYKTFRYFYKYFKDDNIKCKIEVCWKEVKKYFQIFKEWYNDLEMYHYVGYLIENERKLSNLLEKWNGIVDKKSFISYLQNEIKDKVNPDGKNIDDLLGFQYENDKGIYVKKTKCKPILLFHNIQSVINQNTKNKDQYDLGVFYKFPFHLYKKEKWDVEHINSATTNDLSDEESQKEWLLNIYLGVGNDMQEDIKKFLNGSGKDKKFSDLQKEIGEKNIKDDWSWEDKKDKNKIWNYALLDSSTNRSYGNAIFSAKRRIIIGKDQGKLLYMPKLTENGTLEIEKESDAKSSFVPPCTKNIFMKYYSPLASDFNSWSKNDAEFYKQDIKNCIEQLMKENDNEQ